MRFISWNVNGLRAVVKKGFETVFAGLDADFSAFRRRSSKPGRLTCNLTATRATGATPRKRATPARRFLQSTSP